MRTGKNVAIPQNDSFDNEELPEGWNEVLLSKILLTLESGSRPKGGVRGIETGIPSVGGEHLNNSGGFRFENIKYIPMPFFEKMRRGRIQKGDILIVKDGATTGRVSLVRSDFPYNPAMVNEHVFICRFIEEIYSPFVFYYLFSQVGQNRILENFQGSAQGGINQTFAENTIVPIAPLSEQQRIVARVEALLTHVNTARDLLNRMPLIMKRFRQAVLAAACSGRLTEGWRGENPDVENASLLVEKIIKSHKNDVKAFGGKAGTPTEGVHDISEVEIPDSWTICELKYLSKPGKPITYGILKPGQDIPNGIPYIRVVDFPNNKLNLKTIRHTTPEIAANYKRSTLSGNDLLLSIRGTVGRVCQIPLEFNGGNITQDSVRISVHDSISRKYIELYLQTPSVQKRFENAIKGVAIRGVNVGDVRVLQVALPPLAEQHDRFRCPAR
jgi:type I restriction enzyme S subunit